MNMKIISSGITSVSNILYIRFIYYNNGMYSERLVQVNVYDKSDLIELGKHITSDLNDGNLIKQKIDINRNNMLPGIKTLLTFNKKDRTLVIKTHEKEKEIKLHIKARLNYINYFEIAKQYLELLSDSIFCDYKTKLLIEKNIKHAKIQIYN